MNNEHMLLCTKYFIIVVLHTMFTVYPDHFSTIRSLTQLLTTHSCFLLDWPFERRLASQELWLPSSLPASCFHEASCHVLTCPLERSRWQVPRATSDQQPTRKWILPTIKWVGTSFPRWVWDDCSSGWHLDDSLWETSIQRTQLKGTWIPDPPKLGENKCCGFYYLVVRFWSNWLCSNK